MVFLVSPRRKLVASFFLWPLGMLCSGLAGGCKEESNRDDPASPTATTGVGVYTADTFILAQAIGDLIDELASARRSWFRKPRIKGLYLYGSVGVGKTYLMDLFYENI